MRLRLLKYALATALAFCAFGAARETRAHPHVWVTVKSEIIYDDKGMVTGIRHAWEFDDMYSTFALEGLPQKTKGVFTREELAPLAEVNITNLRDSDFFTYVKAGGKDIALNDASDYWLEYKNEVLTLYFTLPLKTGAKEKELSLEVYDPTFFVDFGFAEKDAVALRGAPAQCKATLLKPKQAGATPGQQVMSDAEAVALGNLGVNYASKISVKCP